MTKRDLELLDNIRKRLREHIDQAKDRAELRLRLYVHLHALYQTVELRYDSRQLHIEVEKMIAALERAQEPAAKAAEIEKIAWQELRVFLWGMENQGRSIPISPFQHN